MAVNNRQVSSESPENPMTTISHHHFKDSDDVISITIIESMKEEYGLFVWPCSDILAEYVWQQRVRFNGVSVVEVLNNMRRVCELSNVKCEVVGLTWGVWDESLFSLQPHLTLGADVLYDSNAGIILLSSKW